MDFIFLFLVAVTLIENVCPNPIAHRVEHPSQNSLSRTLNKNAGGMRKLGISWGSQRIATSRLDSNDKPIQRKSNDAGHSTHTLHSHGDPCNTADTPIEVGCKTYSICRRMGTIGLTDGVVTQETCETNYFPVQIVSASGETDATCKNWNELDEARKNEILTDPKCTICTLITEGPCSSKFMYRNKNGGTGASNNCPGTTIMDVIRNGCIEPCDATGTLLAECRANGKCAN